MPGTYYNFQRRDREQPVNWVKEGQAINKKIDDRLESRETERLDIAKEGRDFNAQLSDIPEGQHDGLVTKSMELSEQAQAGMLEIDEKLHRGEISVKEHHIYRENLKRGTTNFYNNVSNWQKEYANKMERMTNGEGADLEVYNMKNLEQFNDLTKIGLHINSKTGVLSMARKVQNEAGEWVTPDVTDGQNLTSIDSFGQRMATNHNKYNVSEALNERAEQLGSYVKVIMSRSDNMKTMDDIRQMPEWTNAANKFTESQLAVDENTASILMDHIKTDATGEDYYWTQDKAEADANANAILVEQDAETGRLNATISPAQMEHAKKVLMDEYNALIDHKETAWIPKTTSKAPTAEQLKQQKIRQEELGIFKAINNIISGDDNEFNASADNRRGAMNRYYREKGIDTEITEIDRTEESINVTMVVDGKPVTEEIDRNNPDGTPRSKEAMGEALYRVIGPSGGSYAQGNAEYLKEGGWTNSEGGGKPATSSAPFKPVTNRGLYSKLNPLADQLVKSKMNSPGAAEATITKVLTQGLEKFGAPEVSVTTEDNTWKPNVVTIQIEGRDPIVVDYDSKNFDKNIGKVQAAIDKELKAIGQEWNDNKGQVATGGGAGKFNKK